MSYSNTEEDLISARDRREAMPKLPLLDYQGVTHLFEKENIKLSHLYKIWHSFVKKGATSVDDIPDIPKAAYRLVNDYCVADSLVLLDRQDSADGSTTKLLIQLFDGHKIEAVIMRYGHVELDTFPKKEEVVYNRTGESESPCDYGDRRFKSTPRATLCVSSQVGCAMGCHFCATGTMGLRANLTCGEILDQLVLATRLEPIRNVVFMGMGEPLDNYREVVDAIRLMSDVRVFNMSAHRVCVSTVGVVPRLRQLQHDAPGVSLALSLHAPTQQLRQKIVPSAKTWDIQDVLEAAISFVKNQREQASRRMKQQTVLIEYVMIENVNVSSATAHAVGKLLHPHVELLHLNLIPYNPTLSSSDLLAPTEASIDAFLAIVRSYGIRATVRQTLGQDISSACGQLVVSSHNGCSHDVEDAGVCSKTSTAPRSSKPNISVSFASQTRSTKRTKRSVAEYLANLFNKPESFPWLASTTVLVSCTAIACWWTLRRRR